MTKSKPNQLQKQSVRCVVYTRVSSEEGLKQGFTSPDNQLSRSQDYIKSRSDQGWFFSRAYQDDGFTGGNLKRPALMEMLNDAKMRKFDILILHKLDRLSRRLLEFHQVYKLLEDNSVDLVSVTQSIDTSTPMGRLMINILLSFAEFELDQTSERQRDKAYASKQRGLRTGGRPILGYDVDPVTKQYAVNEAEAELVNEIFERFVADPRKNKLAAELNSKGVKRKTWLKRDGTWAEPDKFTPFFLTRLLSCRTYVGEVFYERTGEVFPGAHKPIVDRKLFDKAQHFIDQKRHVKHSRERSEVQALLKHIVFCGACDEPMAPKYSGQKEKGYYEYVCRIARSKGYRYCPNPSIPADQLEALVVEQIRAALRTDEAFSVIQRQLEVERKRALKAAKQQLVELKKKKTEREQGGETEHWQPAPELQEELAKAQILCHRLEHAPFSKGEVAKELQVFDRIWENLFPKEQERIAKLLVKSVTVESGSVMVDLYDNGMASLVREISKAGVEILTEDRNANTDSI